MPSLSSIIAAVFGAYIFCYATGLAQSADDAEANYELFEELARSSNLRVRHRDLAVSVLAASPQGRQIAIRVLAQDDLDRIHVACAVLGASPSRPAYEALRAVAADESRPMKIRSAAGSAAVSMAGGGLTFLWPDIDDDSIEAYLRWLKEHPVYSGAEHHNRLREVLSDARDQFLDAIERDDETDRALQPPFNAIGLVSKELGLRRIPTDCEAFLVLHEHVRAMLELPQADPTIERTLTNLTKWNMQQIWWHACLSPDWLVSVKEATSRDDLRELLVAVDPEPDRHTPQPRVLACINGLQTLGFEVGSMQSPARNLEALHQAIRSDDPRAAFLAGEVLFALGVIAWPLPPPPEDAPLVTDAWRSVVLRDSALHAAQAGTAPVWDEARQSWILASICD